MAQRKIEGGRYMGTVRTEPSFGDKWGDLIRAAAAAAVGSIEEQLKWKRTARHRHSERCFCEHYTDLIMTGRRFQISDLRRVETCTIDDERRFAREMREGYREWIVAREEARRLALTPPRKTRRRDGVTHATPS